LPPTVKGSVGNVEGIGDIEIVQRCRNVDSLHNMSLAVTARKKGRIKLTTMN
jgi:hypothetical protein